jgi:hypothetical protein
MNARYLINLSWAAARFPLNYLKDKDLNIETEDSYSLCNKTVPDVSFLRKEFQ